MVSNKSLDYQGNVAVAQMYIGRGKATRRAYGFDEIAHNFRQKAEPIPFQFTLTAIGYTHVIVIPSHLIEELVLPGMPPKSLPPLIVKSNADATEPDNKEDAAPGRLLRSSNGLSVYHLPLLKRLSKACA